MDILSKHLSTAVFFDSSGLDNKTLKQMLHNESGINGRRLSRLSLIAALGALRMRQHAAIRTDCAVYVATPFASPALFQKMADNVLNHHAAMPFDFMANLHNAPAFHAAQALGSNGATVVCAADHNTRSWQKALRLAEHALLAEPQIALGFCREREQETDSDGCVWLLLERNSNKIDARLNHFDKADKPSENPHYWQSLIHCLADLNHDVD